MRKLFFLLSCSAFAQTPYIVSMPTPDFGVDSTKPRLILPVMVDFVIEDNGAPYSAKAPDAGLPDAFVRALIKAKFRPDSRPYSVSLPLKVPYLIEDFAGGTRTGPSMPEEITKAAASLSTKKALELDAKPRDGNNGLRDRAALVLYAGERAEPEMLGLRMRQLEWLVQNAPREAVLRAPASTVARESAPEAYDRIQAAWRDQLAKSPNEFVLLEAATNFLRLSRPDEVRRLLQPYAASSLQVQQWIAEADTLASIGVVRLPFAKAPPALTASIPAEAGVFRERLLDAELPSLLTGMITVSRLISRLDNAAPDHVVQLCEALREKILAFQPTNSSTCMRSAPAPENTGERIVSRAQLRRQVRPLYPQYAKLRKIQGVVTLSATIGKDGKVHHLGLVSGPLALYESAHEAVRQWEYSPYKLNGEPVEVLTEIDVNYAIQ